MIRLAGVISIVLVFASFTSAQTDPIAGIIPFSTRENNVDLATGAITLEIPIRSKVGKIPVSFNLVTNSNAYRYTNIDNDTVWAVSYGFRLEAPSLLSFSLFVSTRVGKSCANGGSIDLQGISIVDMTGALHGLPTSFVINECSTAPLSPTTTTDGSGYTLVVANQAAGPWTLYDPSGLSLNLTADTAEYDPDGVSISITRSSSQGPPYTTTDTYNDSLGQTALTATSTYNSNDVDVGDAYTYAGTNNPAFSVEYSSLSNELNFECPGTLESGIGFPLPTIITTPTGGEYTISYEPSPGISGDVTGRIAEITYPSGGSITYAYSGGNSGINCTSGVVPTLTVTVNDNNGNSKTYTYVNSNTSFPGSAFTVTKTDPAGNQTVYSFDAEYQTQAAYYQGSATGTPLKTVTTCYNGNFTSCATPSTGPAQPFSQTDVYTTLNGSATNLVETKFDSYGNTIEVKQYDFGVTLGAAPTVSPLSDTLTYYGQSWNGTSCTAYPSGTYIYNTPCYSYTKNSAGATIAHTQITYSNTGHPTSTVKWTGSSSLTSTATYNTNGTLATSTDANGIGAYTYAYNGTDGCNNLLPTSVTVKGSGLPSAGLTTSVQWNCNGAVPTQTTDPNQQATTYTYNDPLWRITSMTDPVGNVTNYSYPTQTTFETAMNFNGTVSTSDTLITTDGLGRKIFSQTRQGQGSSLFDTVQTTYGWSATGPSVTTTVPYSGTQAEPAPSGTGSTTSQGDALGRPSSVSNTGGGVVNNTYSQNDVLSVLGPAPTGEHTKQTQTQYDGLGRVTSVCGIESSGGAICGQVTGSLSGVVTTTAYTSASGSQTVTATRASQSRSSVVDGVGRTTQKVTPEGGTWNYYYDSYSSCPSGYTGLSGQLTAIKDPNGNLLCYAYDALNRVAGVNANGTTCRWFYYDNSTGYTGTVPTGVTLANQYGRMVEAATDGCTAVASHTSATLTTDEWFAYDKDGRLLNSWELTPNSTQYYKAEMTYTGPSLTGVNFASPSLSAFTYDLDGEGRWNGMLVGSATDVAGVTYNAAGRPTKISIGSGTDYDGYAYDPNTMNMTGWTFQVNSVQETATITPNPNNTIKSVAITDGFNADGTITCSYNSGLVTGTGYDDLGRLIGHSCTGIGGTWGQSFAYDQYDNITKTGSGLPSWNPGYSATTNHYTCTGCTTGSNGNVTNDGTNAYTWNAFSKMASVNMSGSGCSTSGDCIVYDAFGRAVEFDNGSTKTEIWYSPIGKHYLNGTTPLYGYEAAPGGGTIFGSTYMHKDWIGNARVISSVTASTITTDRAFAPYGEVFNIFGGTGQSDIMFAGLDQGIFAGMYDTPNRELQGSQQGRWLSPDPAGSGWNQYTYVTNPNSGSDPTGLGDQPGSNSTSCTLLGGCISRSNGCMDSRKYTCWLGDTGGQAGSVQGWDAFEILQLAFTPTGYNKLSSVLATSVDGEIQFTEITSYDPIYGNTGLLSLLFIGPGGYIGPRYRSRAKNWQQGPDPLAIARSMRFGLETAIPTVCGGGVFGYAGKGGTAFGVKGFSGAIYEWDSNNGTTTGTLKEAGAGGVGVGFIHSSSGLSGLGYAELGEIPGVADAGAVGGNGWAGGYVEGGLFGAEVGGGAYADITSVAACDPW